jgi:hypothetical protein
MPMRELLKAMRADDAPGCPQGKPQTRRKYYIRLANITFILGIRAGPKSCHLARGRGMLAHIHNPGGQS